MSIKARGWRPHLYVNQAGTDCLVSSMRIFTIIKVHIQLPLHPIFSNFSERPLSPAAV